MPEHKIVDEAWIDEDNDDRLTDAELLADAAKQLAAHQAEQRAAWVKGAHR